MIVCVTVVMGIFCLLLKGKRLTVLIKTATLFLDETVEKKVFSTCVYIRVGRHWRGFL